MSEIISITDIPVSDYDRLQSITAAGKLALPMHHLALGDASANPIRRMTSFYQRAFSNSDNGMAQAQAQMRAVLMSQNNSWIGLLNHPGRSYRRQLDAAVFVASGLNLVGLDPEINMSIDAVNEKTARRKLRDKNNWIIGRDVTLVDVLKHPESGASTRDLFTEGITRALEFSDPDDIVVLEPTVHSIGLRTSIFEPKVFPELDSEWVDVVKSLFDVHQDLFVQRSDNVRRGIVHATMFSQPKSSL